MSTAINLVQIEDALKEIGFPDIYAEAAVALIAAQKYPPKTQKAFGEMALSKCRMWVINPFAKDCPPCRGRLADPNHARDNSIAYIDQYNHSIGIPPSLRQATIDGARR